MMEWKFQYHLFVSLLLIIIMTNYVSSIGNGTETQSQNGTVNGTETQSQNGTLNGTETQSQNGTVNGTETQSQNGTVNGTETQSQNGTVNGTETQSQNGTVNGTETQSQNGTVNGTETQSQTGTVNGTETQSQNRTVNGTETQSQRPQNETRTSPKSRQEFEIRKKYCQQQKQELQINFEKISRVYTDIQVGQQNMIETFQNLSQQIKNFFQNTTLMQLMGNEGDSNMTALMQLMGNKGDSNMTALMQLMGNEGDSNMTTLMQLMGNEGDSNMTLQLPDRDAFNMTRLIPNLDKLTQLMQDIPNFDFSQLIPDMVEINITALEPDRNMTQAMENGDFTQLMGKELSYNFSQLMMPDMANDWQSLYPEDCKHVDSFSVQAMKAEEALEWVMNSEGDKQTLNMLTDESTGLSLAGIKTLIKDMTDVLDNSSTKLNMPLRFQRVITAFLEAYFKQKGGYRNMTMQDVEDLGSSSMESISPDSYNQMPNAVFDNVLESFNNATEQMLVQEGEMQGNHDLMSMMYSDQPRLKALCRASHTRYNQLDTLSVSDLNKLRFLLPCAKASECKRIPNSWVHNNINLLNKVMIYCNDGENDMERMAYSMFPTRHVCGVYIAEKALTGGNISLATPGDLQRISSFLNCVPASYIKTAINEDGCNFTKTVADTDLISTQVKKYNIQNCFSMPDDLTELNCTSLFSMLGPYISEMKMSFYDRIPTAVLCERECIAQFNDVEDIPQNLKTMLTKKCFSAEDVVIDSTTVDELGSMVMDLPLEKFDDVTPADLERNIEKIKNEMKKETKQKMKRSKQALMQKLGEKMIMAGKILAIKDSKEIMRELSTKDFKASITDIEADLRVADSETELAFTDSQNKWVMEELKKTKRPSNYTADDIRAKKSLVKGFLKSDIQEMAQMQSESDDPQGIEMAKALCEQKDWPLVPLKAINRDLIVGGLKALNDTAPFSFLTELDIADIDCQCMIHFKEAELALMQTSVCSSVCSKIGSCDRFRCTHPNHRRGVIQACMDCMSLTGPQLTEADVDMLGLNLLSELTEAEFQAKMTGEILSLKIYELKGMCMDKEFRTAVSNLLDTHFGSNGSALDEATLGSLGSAIMFFPQEMQQQMDKAVISTIARDIMEDLMPTDDSAIELKECCETWMSTEDSSDLKQLTHNLMLTIKDSVMWKVLNTRRKRYADSVQGYIQLFGAELPDFDINDWISVLSAKEFTEGLSVMANLTNWSETQKLILLEKAVESWNTSMCNMTAEQVALLGIIIQSFPIEDLACLPLTDKDVMSDLGGLTGWDPTKLSTLAEDYMKALGELECGFQHAVISKINNVSEVVDSIMELGRLEACSKEQFKAIKNLVIDPAAYGPVETWSAADVTELKNILVGLTAEDIPKLSTNALEGLSAQVISELPGAVLAAITDEQLGSLMTSQIALVTDAQKQQMSTAQTTLLDTITAGTVNANTTETVNANTTETVNANTTETVNANTTETANANATETVNANATETVNANATDPPSPITTDPPNPITTDTPNVITTDTPNVITTDTPNVITTDTSNAITTDTANVNATGNATINTPAEAIGSRAGAVVSTVEWMLSLAVILILIES